MLDLPNYAIAEIIHQGPKIDVCRGVRQSDRVPVVIKLLKEQYPNLADIAKLRHEYQLVSSLNLGGVVRAYSMEKYRNGLALILEAFGHESLRENLARQVPPLGTFLNIAIQLADTLGQLHSHRVIHKDLKPSNVIIDIHTGQVKITDFGISSMLAREEHGGTNPQHLQGTLAYISPEQTGRMSRSLDYRTDFYSLGVMFYELLSGQRPFDTQDPIELVHCHLAKNPRSLTQLVPGIPPVLRDIVHRLLAKNAEDRYQSAFGLKADLEQCRQQLTEQGQIEAFEIGRHDRSGQLRIAQKLYGREQAVKNLLASFERVQHGDKQGQIEIVLVTGQSGIGKSSLVNQIQIPVTQARSYFIAGKADQLKRDIPYAPIRQSFESLVEQLLTEKTAQLEQWRAKILAALGNSAQAIIEVIPKLALILGTQPPVPDLPPTEAQNRFIRLFAELIQVFARRDHPLVLFLDDLQWADLASLELLSRLTTSQARAHVLLIGAYRDNEVAPGHPLLSTLNAIAAQGYSPVELAVTPLSSDTVLTLMSDAMPESDSRALRSLAKLLHQKTQGNPFFVAQMLKTLYDEEQLQFDFNQGIWRWDLDRIQTVGITDLNLIDLIVSNLKKLAPQTQTLLKIAACIGTRFDLQTLAPIVDQSPLSLAQSLMPALQQSMVLPLNFELQTTLSLTEEDWQNASASSTHWVYRFLHDRIHQAAYSLVEPVERADIHARLGHLMLQSTPKERRSEVIFDIVNQLNAGIAIARTLIEPATLADLNLQAAAKAKRAAAYRPAYDYAKVGLELLSGAEPCDRALSLALYQINAELAYLVGEFDASDRLIRALLAQAQSPFEQAAAYDIQLRTYVAQKRLAEAIALGLDVLALFDIKLPSEPSQDDVGAALMATAQLVAQQDISHLDQLPPMVEPGALTAMQVIGQIASSAYIIRPPLYILLITAMVKRSLEKGNAPLSSFAYASYGLLMCGVVNDITTGYQLGKSALTITETSPGQPLKNRVIFLVANFINPWCCHPHESLPLFQRSLQAGLETGDWEFVAWCYWRDVHFLYLTGHNLTDLLERLHESYQLVSQIKQAAAANLIALQMQVVTLLTSDSVAYPLTITGEYYSEADNLAQYQATGNLLGCYELHCHKMMVAYWLGDYDLALAQAKLADQFLPGVTAAIEQVLLYFYDALIRLTQYLEQPAERQTETLQKVTENHQKLMHWASHAPMNYQHKADLVAAEIARVKGQPDRALALYNSAIESASQQGYVQEAALAYELSAELNLKLGNERIGTTYLINAFHAYARWGAIAKVRQMEQRYPQWLSQASALRDPDMSGTTITVSTSSTTGSADFDLISVVRASQAIADEIVLENLLGRLIQLIVENAGAQTGYLVLQQEKQWLLQAAHHLDGETSTAVKVLQGLPLESDAVGELLSVAIANYVIRAGETVLLNNAINEGTFTHDSYILAHQPKSILCTPLLYKGQLRGVIYLENRLTTGAFTTQRLQVLNLLSGQAAISLENALLYREQEKLNQHLAELNRAYERFVPNQFLKLLDKGSIVEVEIGDQTQRNMSVLFADIRNFTAMSEQMNPAENFRFINDFLSRMEPAITDHGGFIDKYIGDAIMALFDGSADDALRAAIAMLKTLNRYNQVRQRSNLATVRLGIGINTGSLMLGTVGGANRMDGTVISDTVNVAARIEQLTKEYAVSLLISHHTFLALADASAYAVRLIDRVAVRGRTSQISVYEVFDADEPEVVQGKIATRPQFEQALIDYTQGQLAEAQAGFKACLNKNPTDTIAQLYLKRCSDSL